MTQDIKLSAVICTHNRCKVFSDTLRSFMEMELPESSRFELLLVDNCSTDDTRSVAESFVEEHGEFSKYIYEPRQGLSYARNAGIRAANGETVAFLDDDIYLDKKWLVAMLNALEKNPDAASIGGRAIPVFEHGRPDWIEDDFMSIYGDAGFGDSSCWLEFPKYPFGLNMAFRKSVFETVGYFNEHLGRKKLQLLSNEELDLFYRISMAKLKVFYTPDAIVKHRIPPERTTIEWIYDRFYWQGISDVIFQQSIARKSKLTLFKEAVADTFNLLGTLRGGAMNPKKIYWHIRGIQVKHKIYFWYRLGAARQKIRESLKL